jgi:hypothetical protein
MKLSQIGKILFGDSLSDLIINIIKNFSKSTSVNTLTTEDIVILISFAKCGHFPLFYNYMIEKLPWADDDYIKDEYDRLGNIEKAYEEELE